MAIKVKKKQTVREEAKVPDQILTHTGRVFNFIEKQKVHLLVGLGVLLLVIIVATALSGHVKHQHNEAGATLLRASQLLTAPIGEPQGAPIQYLPVFPTRQARLQAVEDTVGPNLTSDQAAAAAELIAAVASHEANDLAEAELRYQAAARKATGPLLSVLASQGVAAVQAETGDIEAARGTLEQLAEAHPSLRLFADLEAARLTEAHGDLQTAHDLYRTIVTQHGTSAQMSSAGSALIDIARNRAQLLAVALGLPEETAEQLPVEPEGAWDVELEVEEQAVEAPPETPSAPGTGSSSQELPNP